MKGTTFFKSLEYNLETIGERWRQGEKIQGILKIKNNSTEKVELPFFNISLCSGNYKKIKSKNIKAWEVLAETTLGKDILIQPLEEKEFPWNFVLPEDCRITDKDGSLYLTFLDKTYDWPTGYIELIINPKIVMLQFLEIFENFLRFKVAQTKFSKGMVEVKLKPATSREFSHVESLVIQMKEVDENLSIVYIFNLNVLEMLSGNLMAQKKIKQFEQTISSKQFYLYKDSPNQDFIIELINSVLKEIKPKFL